MAKKGIIPTENAFERIRATVKHYERTRPVRKARRQPRQRFFGGKHLHIIRFVIYSADPAATPPSASVTIDAARCGVDTGDVPGESGGRVTVYDTLGCLLGDEAAADLVGRKGFAVYMDNGATCRWEIISLCCP